MTDSAKEKSKRGKVSNLPMGGMEALLRIEAMGRAKHTARGWVDVDKYPVEGYVDAMFRHLAVVFKRGFASKDEESGEAHMAHVAWNAMRILHFLETGE